MSHALTTRANGFTEMAFVGETPWHKLGQELTAGAPIETWITQAGMEWRIKRSKVRYHFGHDAQDFAVWDDKHVLFRSDTHAPLGLVSPKYKPVQPFEVLEFFRDLTANAGYQLHTAGTIHGGRKMWALAKVAEGSIGGDKIGAFLLLSTACDGTMETEARFTTVRVVCNNTLTMARGEKANVKIGHRSRFDADKVKQAMGLAPERFSTFLDDAEKLAHRKVTQAEAESFVRELLRPADKQAKADAALEATKVAIAAAQAGPSSDFARLLNKPATIVANTTADDETKRAPKGESDILDLFRGEGRGSNLPTASGTAWGLVNAVTEYVDHKQSAKTIDHRLDRAFFGSGEELKNRAMEMALSM
jgi:phage/plasmid-like protein (TIGR03299 family)